MNVYRAHILLLQYSTVEIMFYSIFLCFSHFTGIALFNYFEKLLRFPFVLQVEISLSKRTSRALGLIITLS